MASAASELSEPHVLAHTKRHLFPDDRGETTYAVVDTQFTSERWLADGAITAEIAETLAPFNHVRIGTGYPDLVGVRSLDDDLVAVNRLGSEPPLIAVEAKGYTKTGTVDVERGVVQAYDRLHEANAAYVTAPSRSISESSRTLARELNVGVLAVEQSGDVTPLELPRVVGNRTTTEAEAIRFQASAQGVLDDSFGLNHPKNYLGYPLAHYADGPTEKLMKENKIVREIGSAKRGATVLGLIEERPSGVRLTALGREVVRFGIERYGSVERALDEFRSWYRKSRCFYDLAPEWGLLARRVVFDYPATQLIVEELQHLHVDGEAEPPLSQFVEYLYELHPTFTVELFVRGTDDARNRVLGPSGELRTEALADGNVYHSPTVFQFKAILYHAGILTARGAEPSNLDPTEDRWVLRNSL